EMILVLITAYGTDALEEEIHRLGIGYITKPFEPTRLVQIIHGLIRGQETREGTENAPRILKEAALSALIGQVFIDQGDSSL
ncbi:MAG: hypothetical protein ABIU06_19590, partial [Anaerolineales bacterium]